MHQFRHVSTLFVLVCLTCLAVPAAAQDDPINTEHAVFVLEDQVLKGRVTGDAAVVQSAFAEDAVFIHDNGDERSKAAYVAELPGEPRWTSFSTTERVIHLYGDAAVTHAILYVRAGPDLAVVRLRNTVVYARRTGQWQVVSWQATPLIDGRYKVQP